MANEQETVRVVTVNTSNGPRGINAVGGTIIVARGETSKELVVTAGELLSIRESGNFSIKEMGPGEKVVTDDPAARPSRITQRMDALEARLAKLEGGSNIKMVGPTVDEIRGVIAMADDKNVSFPEFKAAASKLLNDRTPARKDEIVAALEELATKP